MYLVDDVEGVGTRSVDIGGGGGVKGVVVFVKEV